MPSTMHYTDVLTYLIISPLIALTIIGNVLILIVKLYRRKLKSFNSGDLFIVNLAVCDLNKTWCVFLIWIYNGQIYKSWQFNDISCSILMKLVIILLSVSSLTLLVLTTERYLLVVKPFNRSFTFKRAQILLAVIWLTFIVMGLIPHLMSYGVYEVDGARQCRSSVTSKIALSAVVFYFIVVIFIPCILIMILSRTAARVLAKNFFLNKDSQLKTCPVFNAKMRRNKSAIYILRSISLCYILCYVPWAVIYLLEATNPTAFSDFMTNSLATPVISWCLFGSFCNTPLTYIIFSQEFRKEVRRIFHRRTRQTNPMTRDSTVPNK